MMYYTISVSAEFYVFLLILLLVFSSILCFSSFVHTSLHAVSHFVVGF